MEMSALDIRGLREDHRAIRELKHRLAIAEKRLNARRMRIRALGLTKPGKEMAR